jgi:putative ABC transport system permease protein
VQRLLAYALEALDAIWRNRVRSFLTMLGMIVGTSSVIAILGVSGAASSAIGTSLGSFGDPGIYVGVDPKGDDPDSAAIQYRDTAEVANEHAGIFSYVFPDYARVYELRAGNVKYATTVSSTDQVHFDSLTLREGRRIGAQDVDDDARVCLISQPLEERLFGRGSFSVGRIMRINGVRFRVIGVYDQFKASIFSAVGQADYIEIPHSTFHDLAPGPVDTLNIYMKAGVTLAQATDAAEATLHHIHGPRAAYQVQDALAFLQAFEKTVSVVGYGLAAIGGVALVVAGIGIMNIMLVSVSERTREIGIRKAIGGSGKDITTQFLMEAVILSLIGGATGMLLGIAALLLAYGLLAAFLGPGTIPWITIVSVAVGFSTLVGVLFGTYPAVRAGKLDPIEALRS